VRDAVLAPQLHRLGSDDFGVCGGWKLKLWKAVRRSGHDIDQDQVA
jgi:hypothetical protein